MKKFILGLILGIILGVFSMFIIPKDEGIKIVIDENVETPNPPKYIGELETVIYKDYSYFPKGDLNFDAGDSKNGLADSTETHYIFYNTFSN